MWTCAKRWCCTQWLYADPIFYSTIYSIIHSFTTGSSPYISHTYIVPLICWPSPQLGVVAHSCDSAAGELGLWIVVGWDPLDEAGHVELVSALSLVSTWVPPGSRR